MPAIDGITKEYLVKLMKRYQKYEIFSTYLETDEDVGKIRLQDVYLSPYILEFEDAKVMPMPPSEAMIRKQISGILAAMSTRDTTRCDEAKEQNESDGRIPCFEEKTEKEAVKRYKKVVYASKGGGKTSFLSIYALQCAYKLLGQEAEEDRSLERLMLSHDVVSAEFEIDGSAVPVFIHALEFFLAREEGKISIEKVLVDTIARVLNDTVRTRAEQLYKENAIALLVDDADSLPSGCLEEVMEALYEYLEENNEKVHTVVLTGLNHPINCDFDDFIREMKVERYVLPELQYGSVDWMMEFARRWYSRLGNVSARKMDVEKDFLLPFSRDAELLSRIASPRDLTNILLISTYDSCLPTDAINVMRRLFEIKLEEEKLDEGKIVPRLAEAAYEMMKSGEGYIKERELKRYLAGEDEELQAYAFDLSFDDEMAMDFAIDDFEEKLHVNAHIDGLESCGILVKEYAGQYEVRNTDEGTMFCYDTDLVRYKFRNEDERAYCVAYAIKYNFGKRESKKERFAYFWDRVMQKDKSWRKVFACLAVIDEVYQDRMIRELLVLAQSAEDSLYYADLLLDLASLPEVDFFFAELEKLFEILLKPCNWELFVKETGKIEHMILKNSPKENALFAKMMLEKGETVDNQDEHANYYRVVNNAIAFCIQQCDPGEVKLEDYPGYVKRMQK